LVEKKRARASGGEKKARKGENEDSQWTQCDLPDVSSDDF